MTVDLVEKCFTFKIGSMSFVAFATDVLEVMMVPELIRPSENNAGLIGVANIRGNIVPVIDIRSRLRLGAAVENSPLSRLVVFQSRNEPVGIIVEAVEHKLREVPKSVLNQTDNEGLLELEGERFKHFVIEDIVSSSDQKLLKKLQEAF